MASRYTVAYSRFITRLSEVEILLSIAQRTQISLGSPPRPIELALANALCRSAVVLLCSHVEGYIEDLGTVVVDKIAARQVAKSVFGDRFRYHLSRDIIHQIKDASDHAVISQRIDRLMLRDGHVWDNNPNFTSTLDSARFVSDFNNPTHGTVRSFLRRFGYEDFERDMRRNLRGDYHACTNMINQVVDQRNKIAHGDSTTVSAPNDVKDMVRLVKQYCRSVDCTTADWFRQKGCPIR